MACRLIKKHSVYGFLAWCLAKKHMHRLSSLKVLFNIVQEGASAGVPSLETLEDVLGKSPDAGIFLHGGPLPSEGNVGCGGGTLREGSFTGEPRR